MSRRDLLTPHLESDAILRTALLQGRFGIEAEFCRVTGQGDLALTPHPEALGDKALHPFITTDFSESQVELITPPMHSIEEAVGVLKTLHGIVIERLPDGEWLWPQSMPPRLPEDAQIPIASYPEMAAEKAHYRAQLATVYGRARQLISGVHFNVSLSDAFFVRLAELERSGVEALKERVYLKVLRNLMRSRWLWVGLLGRAPIADPSLRLKDLDTEMQVPVCCQHGVSIRSSKIGYRNRNPLRTDFCCLAGYRADLAAHIAAGRLLNPNELYLPVRVKFNSDGGISHLELRFIDLDPEALGGVSVEALRLLHLAFVDALLEPEMGNYDADEQDQADALQDFVACNGLNALSDSSAAYALCACWGDGPLDLRERAVARLDALVQRLQFLPWDTLSRPDAVVSRWLPWIQNPARHPVQRIKEGIGARGFIGFHMELARQQAALQRGAAFRLHGYEDLELSTQILMRAALARGVGWDVVDRAGNFIRLKTPSRSEWVVQATKTRLDPYSHILLMESKLATKFALGEAGIAVPVGERFDVVEAALSAWSRWEGRACVIKPNATNFGIGVHLLPEHADQKEFTAAVREAARHDRTVLIEEWVPGREFRFIVIAGQVLGVLERIPANVSGDGQRSIQELVALKNQDSRRGKGYRTPLEKITLGEVERAGLAAAGLTVESIPAAGQMVLLRANSNISTGGDSVDRTDEVHPSYRDIALAAVRALGVSISGVDMILSDLHQPAQAGNHAIIEMNFNPAIHIHCFPAIGQGRPVAEAILDALGF